MLSNIDSSSSIFIRPEGGLEISVKMKSLSKFLDDNSINNIDLMYMNIEGSEYKLLPHIIKSGKIKNIKYLQIQFHNFVDNSKELRRQIRKDLKKTHRCIFNFPFIWESWKIN